MGHILRKEEDDPERKTACDRDFIRTQARHKRLYGPRGHWWDANMKLAYETISGEQDFQEITGIIGTEYKTNNKQQHRAVADWAENRFPPFGKGSRTIQMKEKRKENREK